jgi:hypothetical protein
MKFCKIDPWSNVTADFKTGRIGTTLGPKVISDSRKLRMQAATIAGFSC